MTKKNMLFCLALSLLMLGCDNETRDGQLTLSGSSPVRIIDQSGQIVNFVGGPVTVSFNVHGDGKVSVTMEQAERKAEFSGRIPQNADWNFTLRGNQIGQAVDMASRRNLEFYGDRRTAVGTGDSCGDNGRWITQETWQSCNEDWKVAFADARTAETIGTFSSRRQGQDCLVGSQNLYCQERPDREPGGRHGEAELPQAVKTLQAQADTGVQFN